MSTFEDEIKKHLAQLKADRVTKLAESIAPKYSVEEIAQALELIRKGEKLPTEPKPKNIADDLNKIAKKAGK